MILNLNRGKGFEFNVNIAFEECINLKKFIFHDVNPFYYELVGVISHLKTTNENKNYISFCKNSNNCKWYKYIDENVTESN